MGPIGTGLIASMAFAGMGAAGTGALRNAPPQHRTTLDVVAGIVGGQAAAAGFAAHGAARVAIVAGGLGLLAASVVDAMRGRAHVAAPTDDGDAQPPAPLPNTVQLPDGEQFQPSSITLGGGVLHFDSEVGNTGQAPLEIALKLNEDGSPSRVQQVLFHSDGTKETIPIRGSFVFDERGDHDHLHFDDFVYFQFFRAGDGDDIEATGPEIASGIKQSFFITDIATITGVPPENLEAAQRLEGHGMVDATGVDADVVQGISVGRADVYGSYLEGQSLDVGTLKPGSYILRQTFDPNDEIMELDERNNSREIMIHVSKSQHVTIVGSELLDPSHYRQLTDGRVIVPAIVDSMRTTAESGARSGTFGTPGTH